MRRVDSTMRKRPNRIYPFRAFYGHYLGEHQNAICRLLHYVGCWLVIAFVLAAVSVSQWYLLLLLPIVAYALPWAGHFLYEHNTPATFRQPLFSMLADWRLWWDITMRRQSIDPLQGKRHRDLPKSLQVFVLLYAATSLVHFLHNGKYLNAYPGLPGSWTSTGVYESWAGMTALGALGCLFLSRDMFFLGSSLIIVYSLLGLASLAHYLVAPFSAHAPIMNATILAEVGSAGLLLGRTLLLMGKRPA